MKKKVKKLIGILLSLVLVLTLMPAVSLRAYAYDGNPYDDLISKETDDATALSNKVVHFNDYDWYIIEDNSTAVNAGTVTLFAKDPIGTMLFQSVYTKANYYSKSDVNTYLQGLTLGTGSFASVANAIVTIPSLTTNEYNSNAIYDTASNAKLYLLSKEEATTLPVNIKKYSKEDDSVGNYWWLRSPGSIEERAACVYGEDGTVIEGGRDLRELFAVRPALKLNLAYVDFASNTFTVNKYCPGITTLGTGAIANPTEPSATTDPWNGSYVYYGKYDGTNPTKYRVLDKASTDFGVTGGSLLLDCDSVLYKSVFGSETGWAGSTVKAELNEGGFLTKEGNLTGIEKEAIASSTKVNSALGDGSGSNIFDWVGLSGEKVFLLDAKEVTRTTYGYSDTSNVAENRIKQNNSWWLRSPRHNNNVQNGHIPSSGTLASSPANKNLDVSPAFNVNLSSVIFSSLVSGPSGQAGAEYKLTLHDWNMNIKVTGGTTINATTGVVTVPYTISGANANNATQVSVLLLDSPYVPGKSVPAGEFDYLKLTTTSGTLTAGTGTFTLPQKYYGKEMGVDYYAYILAEKVNTDDSGTADVNEALFTDYASAPAALTKVVTLGNGAILNPAEPLTKDSPWLGNYVWYGKFDTDINAETPATPVKYRVLDASTNRFGGNTLFLDCDTTLFNYQFRTNPADDGNQWSASDVRTKLNKAEDADSFLNLGFNAVERAAIAESTIAEHEFADFVPEIAKQWFGREEYGKKYYTPLDKEKIFLLDVEDILNPAYGYSSDLGFDGTTWHAVNNRKKSGSNSEWRLRSPSSGDSYDAGSVNSGGWVYRKLVVDSYGISPAFNVSLSSVIFSSLISGTSDEYKLTIKDDNITLAVNDTITREGDKIKVPFAVSGNDAGAVTNISLLMTDKNCTWTDGSGWNDGSVVKYYSTASVSGGKTSVTLNLPKDYESNRENWKVWLLAEKVNGEKETDYASQPQAIKVPARIKTESLSDGKVGSEYSQSLTAGGTSGATKWELASGSDLPGGLTLSVDGSISGTPTAAGRYAFKVKLTDENGITEKELTITIKNKPSPPSPGPGPSPSYTYYTVKFEMNGHGEQVSSQTVRSGSKAKRPEDPTAEEYYFAGWFEDAELTTEYDFSSPVRKGMTLYARWEEIRYTVSFDLKGHGSSIETQWVRKNGMAEKPDDPSAEGFTFGGWYEDPDCTELYDFSTPVTKDITLYAKWEEDVLIYRLYNPNSGAHLFTSNGAEKDSLVVIGWEYEGVAWTAPASSNTPVYRVYNPNSGDHHYTKDAEEKGILVALGWDDEGICWYSDENQGTPLYRLYNPNATGQYAAGTHHYTKDVEERDYLIAAGWNDEGIGWYGK